MSIATPTCERHDLDRFVAILQARPEVDTRWAECVAPALAERGPATE
jgi:hypothetical protein